MFYIFSSCKDSRNLYCCLCGELHWELHWETVGRKMICKAISMEAFLFFPCTQFFPSVAEGTWPLSQHLNMFWRSFCFPEDERRCIYILPLSGERMLLGSSTELPQSSLVKMRFSTTIWCKNMKLQVVKKYSSGLVNELSWTNRKPASIPRRK